jgi:hypothetical protein
MATEAHGSTRKHTESKKVKSEKNLQPTDTTESYTLQEIPRAVLYFNPLHGQ